ncbi:Mor transcription activator family protein [Lactobacillus selangorensis]
MVQRYNGRNIQELTREYGYSERWVRRVIHDGKRL